MPGAEKDELEKWGNRSARGQGGPASGGTKGSALANAVKDLNQLRPGCTH